MATLKESLKAARKNAARQIFAEIAAMVEKRPDLSYKQIAAHFGIGKSLVCQAVKEAGLRRPRGSGSPAFRRAKAGAGTVGAKA